MEPNFRRGMLRREKLVKTEESRLILHTKWGAVSSFCQMKYLHKVMLANKFCKVLRAQYNAADSDVCGPSEGLLVLNPPTISPLFSVPFPREKWSRKEESTLVDLKRWTREKSGEPISLKFERRTAKPTKKLPAEIGLYKGNQASAWIYHSGSRCFSEMIKTTKILCASAKWWE